MKDLNKTVNENNSLNNSLRDYSLKNNKSFWSKFRGTNIITRCIDTLYMNSLIIGAIITSIPAVEALIRPLLSLPALILASVIKTLITWAVIIRFSLMPTSLTSGSIRVLFILSTIYSYSFIIKRWIASLKRKYKGLNDIK